MAGFVNVFVLVFDDVVELQNDGVRVDVFCQGVALDANVDEIVQQRKRFPEVGVQGAAIRLRSGNHQVAQEMEKQTAFVADEIRDKHDVEPTIGIVLFRRNQHGRVHVFVDGQVVQQKVNRGAFEKGITGAVDFEFESIFVFLGERVFHTLGGVNRVSFSGFQGNQLLVDGGHVRSKDRSVSDLFSCHAFSKEPSVFLFCGRSHTGCVWGDCETWFRRALFQQLLVTRPFRFWGLRQTHCFGWQSV